MELSHGSTPVDLTRLAMLLLLYAAAGGRAAYMNGGLTRQDFFEALVSQDKAFVIVPDGGDYATIQRPRRRIHKEIADFLLEA